MHVLPSLSSFPYRRSLSCCILLFLALLPAACQPAPPGLQERVCSHQDSDREYFLRWTPGVRLEVDGFVYFPSHVHWYDTPSGWRTRSHFQRSAGLDDQGIHQIYINETRFEYRDVQPGTGVLVAHTLHRLTSTGDAARVRQHRYDYPLPPVTPASEPIQSANLPPGTTYQRFERSCYTPDQPLKMPSDYSALEKFFLILQDASDDSK